MNPQIQHDETETNIENLVNQIKNNLDVLQKQLKNNTAKEPLKQDTLKNTISEIKQSLKALHNSLDKLKSEKRNLEDQLAEKTDKLNIANDKVKELKAQVIAEEKKNQALNIKQQAIIDLINAPHPISDSHSIPFQQSLIIKDFLKPISIWLAILSFVMLNLSTNALANYWTDFAESVLRILGLSSELASTVDYQWPVTIAFFALSLSIAIFYGSGEIKEWFQEDDHHGK